MYLILPALSAFIYALGAISFKKALMCGVGSWRTAFVANLAFAAFSTPLVFFSSGSWPLSAVIFCIVIGFLFLAAQVLTFLALQRGDVSLATPVLGTKVILVVMFASLFGLRLTWWDAASAALTVLALALLSLEPGCKNNVRQTVGYGMSAAGVFSLCDVMLSHAATQIHPGRALFVLTWSCAFSSFILVPRFNGPLLHLRGSAIPWLWTGALFVGVQSAILGGTIAFSGDPSGCNVIYATRGLWSVVLAAVLSRLLGLSEIEVPKSVMVLRGIGALVLLCAIILTLMR